MVRRLALVAVAVLLVSTFAFAGDVEEAEGTVKAVTANAVTVTGGDGAEWTFEATPDSMIKAKGASHKMKDLEAAGEDATLDKFLKADQKVSVKYWKEEGKAYFKEIRVH
jgi:hypothetical protein